MTEFLIGYCLPALAVVVWLAHRDAKLRKQNQDILDGWKESEWGGEHDR